MSRLIAIVAVPGVQLLDVSGPLDVFAEANVQTGRKNYELAVVSSRAEIRSSSGVRILADHLIGKGDLGPLNTLLVAGCPNAVDERPDPAMLAWLTAHAKVARRYGSVCTGAFMLAEAGLLNNRHITTHWAVADQLSRRFPALNVDAEAIHVRDGRVRTAAGVTAGLDLALALVEEDFGREIAQKIAARLVMFFKRPGGQLQFSRGGEAVLAGRSALQEVQRWIAVAPDADHSVTRLAERTGLSPRHFARLFCSEIGVTPGHWVKMARVTAARQMLEVGDRTPKQVAPLCGFANVDTLRRAFVRHLGVTPAQYRKLHGAPV